MAVVYDARLGGHARDADRHRVAAAAPPRRRRRPTGRRSGRRARCSRCRRRRWRGPINARQRLPAGGDAGQPVGLRRLAGVAAPAAARVRRRDRPGHRQLRRPVRAVRRVPLPRRGVRRVLGDAQRRHGGAGRRGLVRVGDRRGAGGGGGVHPRRRRPHPGRRAGPGRWRRRVAEATPDEAACAGPSWPSDARARCAPRSSARSPPSSTPCTASSGPRTSARCTASSPPPTCAPS